MNTPALSVVITAIIQAVALSGPDIDGLSSASVLKGSLLPILPTGSI